MAKAYRCDRCGDYHKGDPANTINTGKNNTRPIALFSARDLCESCAEKVVAFIKGDI